MFVNVVSWYCCCGGPVGEETLLEYLYAIPRYVGMLPHNNFYIFVRPVSSVVDESAVTISSPAVSSPPAEAASDFVVTTLSRFSAGDGASFFRPSIPAAFLPADREGLKAFRSAATEALGVRRGKDGHIAGSHDKQRISAMADPSGSLAEGAAAPSPEVVQAAAEGEDAATADESEMSEDALVLLQSGLGVVDGHGGSSSPRSAWRTGTSDGDEEDGNDGVSECEFEKGLWVFSAGFHPSGPLSAVPTLGAQLPAPWQGRDAQQPFPATEPGGGQVEEKRLTKAAGEKSPVAPLPAVDEGEESPRARKEKPRLQWNGRQFSPGRAVAVAMDAGIHERLAQFTAIQEKAPPVLEVSVDEGEAKAIQENGGAIAGRTSAVGGADVISLEDFSEDGAKRSAVESFEPPSPAAEVVPASAPKTATPEPPLPPELQEEQPAKQKPTLPVRSSSPPPELRLTLDDGTEFYDRLKLGISVNTAKKLAQVRKREADSSGKQSLVASKSFGFGKYGSQRAALEAAVAYRNEIFAETLMPSANATTKSASSPLQEEQPTKQKPTLPARSSSPLPELRLTLDDGTEFYDRLKLGISVNTAKKLAQVRKREADSSGKQSLVASKSFGFGKYGSQRAALEAAVAYRNEIFGEQAAC